MDAFLSTLTSLTISEGLTAGLVLVTIYYAVQTHRTVSAMKEQNVRLIRPYISICPIRDGITFHLRVENTGKTSADNLQLSIDRPFYCLDEEEANLKEQHLFTSGVASFSPGAEVNFLLGTTVQIFGKEDTHYPMPSKFEVTARYSYSGNEVVETTTVDLNQYAKKFAPQIGVTRHLRDAKKSLSSIADSIDT